MRPLRQLSHALAIAGIAALAHGQDQAADASTGHQLVSRAREFLGAAILEGQVRRATGAVNFPSGPGEFELVVAGDGRFLLWLDYGSYQETIGWNGENGWTVTDDRPPQARGVCQLDLTRLFAWFITGFWLQRDAPVSIHAPTTANSVCFEANGGTLIARVHFPTPFGVPTSLDYHGHREFRADSGSSVTLSDLRSIDGTTLPHAFRFVMAGGASNDYVVDDWRTEELDPDLFERPEGLVEPAQYDPEVDPNLPISLSPQNWPLLPATIDGRQGWLAIAFTTGSFVHDDVFEVQQLTGSKLTLGPITIGEFDCPVYPRAPTFEDPDHLILGVAGREVWSRFCCEIVVGQDRCRLAPADAWISEDLPWSPIYESLEGYTMVEGAAGRHSGWFRLGTGRFVGIMSRRFGERNLWVRRPIRPGADYSHAASPWIEVGEHRFENPKLVTFTKDQGYEGDTYSAGLLGWEFYRGARLRLDYRRDRVAFLPE